MRQLKRLLRYVKGTVDMSTVFEMRDNNDRRGQTVKGLEVYTDSDWASDQVTRKSTSGALIMAEIACPQSGTGFRGIEQLRSRGIGSVGRVSRRHYCCKKSDGDTAELKSKWTAAQHMHSFTDEVLDA